MNITVPTIGESVSSGLLAVWLKKDGDYVKEGEELFELETDKANLTVPAPASGVLRRTANEGEEVSVGQVIGAVEAGEGGAAGGTAGGESKAAVSGKTDGYAVSGEKATPEKIPEAAVKPTTIASEKSGIPDEKLSPSVRRIAAEENLDVGAIAGTGKGGRVTKEDALRAVEARLRELDPEKTAGTEPVSGRAGGPSRDGVPGAGTSEKAAPPPAGGTVQAAGAGVTSADRLETASAGAQSARIADRGAETGPHPQRRVPMTRIRQRIAENLVLSKHSSAHLTTFNEIDMSAVMSLRSLHKDAFFEKHGTRLGFMSFFIRASCSALAAFPETNAFVEGTDIVYNDFYDIGVALSTDRGLMTPVIRGANLKSFAALEAEIVSFSERAKEKKIRPDELSGATFTITNGGVFGSLLSTPIPSPPQSAILGMHSIQKRPVVADDQIVIRPMMYVALTYDHRLIDGKEAIGFLMTVKRLIEDPGRLLLDL